jgi:hypothetical protein
MGETVDSTLSYISSNTNLKQIEYPYEVIKDEISRNTKLILTIQDNSYKITQDIVDGVEIESGILNPGNPLYPTFDDNVGIAGYFVSPWNSSHKVFVLSKLSSGFENETAEIATLFSVKP